MLEPIVVLGILVLAVGLLSIGILRLVRAIWRFLTGQEEESPGWDRSRRCPVCDAATEGIAECTRCGWNPGLDPELRRLSIAVRQLEDADGLAELDPDALRRVVRTLDERRQQLVTTAARPSTAQTSVPMRAATRAAAASADVHVDPSAADLAAAGVPVAAASSPEDVVIFEAELAAADTGDAKDVSNVIAADTAAAAAAAEASWPAETTAQPHGSSATESHHYSHDSIRPARMDEPSGSVRERVEKYAARRQQGDLMEGATHAPPDRRGRQPLGRMLLAFLEERNIRWGELIGGLLIVSCSAALVISFWSQISSQPILRFAVFNGVTVGLFLVGIHAARRWKLPSTSQGLLVTATLLVPLNFLAMAAFGQLATVLTPLELAGHVASTIIFAILVYFAGGFLAPTSPVSLLAGVLIPSLSVLPISRWISGTSAPMVATGSTAILIAAYLVANSRPVYRTARAADGGEVLALARPMLTVLGTSSFALFCVLGITAARTGSPAAYLQQCSPLMPLLALAAVSGGTALARRGSQDVPWEWRLTGTAISLAGMFVSLAGIVAAWPEPSFLLAAALTNAVAFTIAAILLAAAELHAVAAACAALAYLIVAHLAGGALRTPPYPTALLEAFGSAKTGELLAGFVVAAVGIVEAMRRAAWRREAQVFQGVAAAGAGLSAVLLTWFGLGADQHMLPAVAALLFYAAVAWSWSLRSASQWADWASGVFVLLASVHGIAYGIAESLALPLRWSVTFLAHATVMLVGWTLADVCWKKKRQPLFHSFCVASITGAILLVLAVPFVASPDLVMPLVWISILWLAAALWVGSPRFFTAFQVVTVAAAVVLVDALLQRQSWCLRWVDRQLDPRSLQAHGVVLASFAVAWPVLRMALRRFGIRADGAGRAERLLYPPWATVDALLMAPVVLGLVWLAAYAAIPGVAQELKLGQPRTVVPVEQFELWEVPHAPARNMASWAVLGLVAIGLMARLRERFEVWSVVGLLAVLAAVPQLMASLFEPQVAAASALRWGLAIAFVIGSAAIWTRHKWLPMLQRFGWPAGDAAEPAVAEDARLCEARSAEQAIASSESSSSSMPNSSAGGVVHAARAAMATISFDPFVWLAAALSVPALAMAAYVIRQAATRHELSSETEFMVGWLGVVMVVSWGVALLMARANIPIARRADVVYSSGSDRVAHDANPPTRGTRATAINSQALVLAILGSTPLVALGLFVVGQALADHPITGPEPGSWFSRIGTAVSYALPLLLVALVLVGHAVDRSAPALAIAAGLLLQLGATAALMITQSRWLAPTDPALWAHVAKLNAVVTGAYAILWMLWIRSQRYLASRASSLSAPLAAQVALGPFILLLLIVPMTVRLIGYPHLPSQIEAASGWWAWAAWLVVTMGIVMHTRIGPRRAADVDETIQLGDDGSDANRIGQFSLFRGLTAQQVAAWLIATAALIALQAAQWDAGRWLAYHTLQAGEWLVGALLLGWAGWCEFVRVRRARLAPLDQPPGGSAMAMDSGARSMDLPSRYGLGAVSAIGGLLLLTGLRAAPADPLGFWWPVGSLLGGASLWSTLASYSAKQRQLFYAALAIAAAAFTWWFSDGALRFGSNVWPETLVEFCLWGIVSQAAFVPVACWITRRAGRRTGGAPRWAWHRLAAAGALAVLLMLAAVLLMADRPGAPIDAASWLEALAAVAVAVAITSLFWDGRHQAAVAGYYFWWLAATALIVVQFHLPGSMVLWLCTILLACYALAASYLWTRREELLALAAWLSIPPPAAGRDSAAWLVPVNGLIAAAVLASAYWLVLRVADPLMRTSAAQAVLAQGVALGLLARGRIDQTSRFSALWMGALGAVALAFSAQAPTVETSLIERAIAVCVALSVTAVVYGAGFAKRLGAENPWRIAAVRMVKEMAVLIGLGIAAVLLLELEWYVGREVVPVDWPELLAFAAALVGLAAVCLVAALVPGRDPFGLSERQRTVYVYAAEMLLGLLFVHLRLSAAWLFAGIFQRYWPLVVMLLAYLGVGLSEWFRRSRPVLLAEPLRNSAALLPVLPVLGYWLAPAEIHYSLVMLAVGSLYGILSALRRSFAFGVLGLLAAQGALWYVLAESDGLGLLEHPQLWLVPPALCVLVAAHIHRRQLKPKSLLAIRYTCSAVIYVASTADIFLAGVAEAPWLPLVLGALSLAGMAAGILLEVRAFLYLGTSFLVVALMTILWYAAVDLRQTWLWYVVGIVAGLLIIVMVGLFEKRRQDIRRVVERLKEWEG